MSYGCKDRPAFRTVFPGQDGWYMDGVTRAPRLVPVRFRMNPACQYTHTELGQADAKCTGCCHRANKIESTE